MDEEAELLLRKGAIEEIHGYSQGFFSYGFFSDFTGRRELPGAGAEYSTSGRYYPTIKIGSITEYDRCYHGYGENTSKQDWGLYGVIMVIGQNTFCFNGDSSMAFTSLHAQRQTIGI